MLLIATLVLGIPAARFGCRDRGEPWGRSAIQGEIQRKAEEARARCQRATTAEAAAMDAWAASHGGGLEGYEGRKLPKSFCPWRFRNDPSGRPAGLYGPDHGLSAPLTKVERLAPAPGPPAEQPPLVKTGPR
jgi:hypothetical protein